MVNHNNKHDCKNNKQSRIKSYLCCRRKVLSTDENSDLGEGKYIVVEADESDGTFTHLQPDVAVLTNIDDDHLVHYNNIFDNLLDSFVMFAENVPFYGYLVINGDDVNIKKISKKYRELK